MPKKDAPATREEVLAGIAALAKKLNRPPTHAELFKKTKITRH
jgi:hypothetical protein